MTSEIKTLTEYQVWPLPVRLFHWLNLLLVLVLSFLGLVMLFKPELGISGNEAKIGLKTAHVVVGYLFIANLALRLVYGLFAKNHGSLGSMLPGPSTLTALKDYKARIARGESPQYLGHNPKGKLAIGAMLVLMLLIALTGLYRAGTDIYYPPFGSSIQAAIVKDGADAAAIKPYDDTYVDSEKLDSIKPLKSLAGEIHVYAVYLLWLIIAAHIAAVIYAENRRQPGLISAMFSGRKWLGSAPADSDK
ncbi:cytochrome b/b6 domain-containing protein [Shewanella sp. JM162201]|uniref:Cytochrome b/b6 domain-containing protein n=1 Tax=Shewanella jiangmenensis TaxID=2837387 RepID=A0ABS5UXY8_9GAMM|nr:cytochrome b/b6 domain-containing protein [Shewanella jiangmenensis]MBT1442953.1 cytochrome b/b6 domain-containing protein [Shewanella jiangmenensis]